MIRLTAVCAVLALLLTACASDTSNPNANGAAGSGTGGYGAGNGAYPGGYPGAGNAPPGSQAALTQDAGDRIYFDTDQSLLSSDARTTLDRQAQWLQQNPQISVWVAGNCDERGTEENNLALGQRRANADREYLESRGIASGRIQTISYGKDRPVDPNTGQEAWAHDRNAITSVR